MTRQLSKIALGAVVALACFGVRAQESGRQAPEKKSTNSDSPLQGLTKVGVIIDSTPLYKIGLSEEKLRSEVVSKLRSFPAMTVSIGAESERWQAFALRRRLRRLRLVI